MRRSLQLAAAAAAATGAYLRWVRPWELRWGATDEEVALQAPGDELVQGPHLVSTHVVTVHAPPERVWPWLVQIGRGRAGWYSYDWLDNGRQHSAREILPPTVHAARASPHRRAKPSLRTVGYHNSAGALLQGRGRRRAPGSPQQRLPPPR